MRMTNTVCVTILGSIFIWVSASYLSAAEIYTWTDKDGNLHITEHPPPKGAKLKEVTTYSEKPGTQESGNQDSQNSQFTDAEDLKKAKEDDAAQRKAAIAAEKAQDAGTKASDAILKAHEAKDKRAAQSRQDRNRVSRDEIKKAEGEAMRAQEKSKEALEKAKEARDKAEKGLENKQD